MKKFLQISAWTLGTLLVLILVLMMAIPPIARSYVNGHGRELCGRDIYIDDIDLNLFRGTVCIDSLNLFERDGKIPFVKFENLTVNIGMARLFTGLVDVEEIHVNRLYVNVEQRDTVFNFSDILAFFDSGEETPADTASASLPVVLEDIRIDNSFVRYQDLVVGSDFKLNDLSVHIPGVDLRELNTSVALSLAFVDGGSFSTNVDYDDQTGNFGIDLTLRHFNLHSILPYLRQSMAATDIQGLLDAHMNLRGNLNHILALGVAGQTNVTRFQLTDKEGKPCLAADSLSLATSEVNLLKNRYGFSYILLKNPDICITMGKDSIDNITRMLTTAVIDQQSEPAPADSVAIEPVVADSTERIGEEPFDLYIDKMVVSGGKFAYTDSTLTYDPFVYAVSNIHFETDSFQLSGINDIAISCAPGTGDGSIDLCYHGNFEDMHNMAVNLDVKQVALKDFSPYVVQMFGNPMTNGTLSFRSDTKVVAGNIDSHNHLIVKNPVVEDKRKDVKPEIKGVPLKAGVYILTDKNGVCDMEVPVTGNIDEPKFSVRRLIFRTLGKLIVKVATSVVPTTSTATAVSATTETTDTAETSAIIENP